MSRMAEDVSRVRMYTGPALMYLINLVALISLVFFTCSGKMGTYAVCFSPLAHPRHYHLLCKYHHQ